MTPLPSTACGSRTKRANSLSNTNNPEQTSWARSFFFCGKGSVESDPLRSHSSLGHVVLRDLLCLPPRRRSPRHLPPAPPSPHRPRSLESRSLAHTAWSRHRQTLGRSHSKRRQAWHAALGCSLVLAKGSWGLSSASCPHGGGEQDQHCQERVPCFERGDRGSQWDSECLEAESVSLVEPRASPSSCFSFPHVHVL